MQVIYQLSLPETLEILAQVPPLKTPFERLQCGFWESQAGSQQVVDRFWIGHLI